MTTVRAAVLNVAPGKLDLESLALDDPGPDEVLIRVAYAELCHSDLHEINGTFATEVPIVLGHEASGVVECVGSAVTSISVGDRVVTCLSTFCGTCVYCTTGRQTLCPERMRLAQDRPRPRLMSKKGRAVRATAGIGAFAEAMIVHQNSVVAIPDDVRLDTASILGYAVTTGMGAVLRRAEVRPGERVAVIGVGGVGIAAVQAARLAGAVQVVAVDVVPEKLRTALRFGATHTVNSSDADRSPRSAP
jgi:S-(hydroxymethyl)glutathione dehydrogenase/alcohol dehydrogenase